MPLQLELEYQDEDPEPGKKTHKWCFTYFDYEGEKITNLENNPHVRYGFYGKEIAPKTGRPHLQGWLIIEYTVRWKWMREQFPGIYCIAMRGTEASNWKYCSKDGDWFEWGTPPKKKGERSDLKIARELAKQRKPLHEIAEVCGYQATRHAELMMKSVIQTQQRKLGPEGLTVIWVYGPTGSGKTHWALERMRKETGREDDDLVYKSPPMITTFWVGYQGEEYVILDDIRGTQVPMNYLTQWLDPYKCIINIKHGHAYSMAKVVIVTTLSHPSTFYEFTTEDSDQLVRRCKEIVYLPNKCGYVAMAKRSGEIITQTSKKGKEEWTIPK